MKKTIIILFVLSLTFFNHSTEGICSSTQFISIGGSVEGSSAYMYTNGLASIINKYCEGIKASVRPITTMPENDRLLKEGKLDMAVHISFSAADAYSGINAYKDFGAHKSLRALWCMYGSSYLTVVAPKSSNIYSIEDLKGKKIGLGPKGSSSYNMFSNLLNVYDYNMDDINIRNGKLSELISTFKDGQVDVIAYIMGKATPVLKDLASVRDIRLIEVPEDKWRMLENKIPAGYYGYVKLPADTYKGQNYDVMSLSVNIWYTCEENFDEKLVQKIMNAFFDNKSEADLIHPTIKETTLEVMGQTPPIPWHPAAKKFFIERKIPFREFNFTE